MSDVTEATGAGSDDESTEKPFETVASQPPQEPPSYEQAREELVEVVRQLEAGGCTLEESLALWERGEKLATICQEWLDGAQAKLDQALEADAEE